MQVNQLRPIAFKQTYGQNDLVIFNLNLDSGQLLVPGSIRLSGLCSIGGGAVYRRYINGSIGFQSLIRELCVTSSRLGIVENVIEYSFLTALMSQISSSDQSNKFFAGSGAYCTPSSRGTNAIINTPRDAGVNSFSFPLLTCLNFATSPIPLDSKLGTVQIQVRLDSFANVLFGTGAAAYTLTDLSLEFQTMQGEKKDVPLGLITHQCYKYSLQGSTSLYASLRADALALSCFGGFRNSEETCYSIPDNSVNINRVLFGLGGSTSALLGFTLEDPQEIRLNALQAVTGVTPGAPFPSLINQYPFNPSCFGCTVPLLNVKDTSLDVTLEIEQDPVIPQNYEVMIYLRTTISI